MNSTMYDAVLREIEKEFLIVNSSFEEYDQLEMK
jgi:hypothetical protein